MGLPGAHHLASPRLEAALPARRAIERAPSHSRRGRPWYATAQFWTKWAPIVLLGAACAAAGIIRLVSAVHY